MVWKTGQLVGNDRYKILGILGEGGFCITYHALNVQGGFEVAIKTPNTQLRSDPKYSDFLQKFKREIKILGELENLRHPNIVRICDVFVEDGSHSLVMGYVQGQTIRQRGKLTEADAVKFMMQIGGALQAIHSQGKVHRDIHPNNIVITPDNQAVLVDFGLVAEMTRSTVRSEVFGHPDYQCPELRRGVKDPRVDIFSLGGTFYFALTGKDPFFDNGELQFPAGIKGSLKRIIRKSMEGNASRRYQDMKEWLEGLPYSEYGDNYQPQTTFERVAGSGLRIFLKGVGIDGEFLTLGKNWVVEGSWSLWDVVGELGSEIRDALDIPWKLLRVPFGIWTATGYLWQTVDVQYGCRLTLYLWAERFRHDKSPEFLSAITNRLREFTWIEATGTTISSSVAGLVLGGGGYLVIRLLFPRSDVCWAMLWTIAVTYAVVIAACVTAIYVMPLFMVMPLTIAMFFELSGKEELQALKKYSLRQCSLLLCGSWVTGAVVGWLLYQVVPLFYIELPAGL